MAQNIREIKRRIKSVNSTKQITRAMELVASAKLRRARERAESRRAYFETMMNSIHQLAGESKTVNNIFLKSRDVKKKAYIIVTGDKGLAGGYNGNIIKMVATEIKDKNNTSIITVGSKGRDYFKKRQYNVIDEYTGISEAPTFFDAKEIGETVMNLFKDGIVDEVYLAYTKFVSTISQKPQLVKLLPLSKEEFENDDKVEDNNDEIELIMTYEPSAGALLGHLIPKYVFSTIHGAMIESSASEQGARRIAMESATDNANEMIDKLTLHYNRARQAAITQELSEIVGGAEALK